MSKNYEAAIDKVLAAFRDAIPPFGMEIRIARYLKRYTLSPGMALMVAVAVLIAPACFTTAFSQDKPAAQATVSQSSPVPQWQTAAGGKMSFDVASVRPAQGGSTQSSNIDLDASEYFRYTGGPIRATGQLIAYIGFAYKIQDTSEYPALYAALPKWAQTESFTVEARAPVEKPTKDQIRLMMQSLLADRFGLRVHMEVQDRPVYALTLTAPGKPGLQPHPADDKLCEEPAAEHPKAKGDTMAPSCQVIFLDLSEGLRRLRMMDYPMAEIAGQLSDTVVRFGKLDARPVVDQTGLPGHFDLRVDFARPVKTNANADAGNEVPEPGLPFVEALKQQAGLELKKTTAPVTVYVIDAVQEPTPN